MHSEFRKIEIMSFGFIGLVSLLVCVLLAVVMLKTKQLTHIAVGWSFALFFSLIDYGFKMKSLGKPLKTFFIWSWLLNTGKAALFFTAVISFYKYTSINTAVFLLSVFVTYFILMFNEVVLLHLQSKDFA